MIRVIYDRKECRLSVAGHANSAEPGKDLVCAGVSALACTLAANVLRLEELGQAEAVTVRLEPGSAELVCRPGPGYSDLVFGVFDTGCLGFALLSGEYPRYISYACRQG